MEGMEKDGSIDRIKRLIPEPPKAPREEGDEKKEERRSDRGSDRDRDRRRSRSRDRCSTHLGPYSRTIPRAL